MLLSDWLLSDWLLYCGLNITSLACNHGNGTDFTAELCVCVCVRSFSSPVCCHHNSQSVHCLINNVKTDITDSVPFVPFPLLNADTAGDLR